MQRIIDIIFIDIINYFYSARQKIGYWMNNKIKFNHLKDPIVDNINGITQLTTQVIISVYHFYNELN